jgi:hypothetical protein
LTDSRDNTQRTIGHHHIFDNTTFSDWAFAGSTKGIFVDIAYFQLFMYELGVEMEIYNESRDRRLVAGVLSEFNPVNGLIKLPENGLGYTTYRYNIGLNWGSHYTISSIILSGRQWNALMSHDDPDVLIHVGNISTREGGNAGQHDSHTGGRFADFRPIRNDALSGPLTYNDSVYSQERTMQMLNIITSFNTVSNLFNDPEAQNVFPGVVRFYRGHDDHIHAQFAR